MKWLELHLDTQPAGIEPATELLSEYGIDSLMIDEEGDFKDFLENNHQYWDYVDDELMEQMHGKSRITFYLEDSAEGYNTLAQFRIGLSAFKKQHPEYAPLILSMENVEDADWENNWKQFYKPMEIGERLLVVPEWEQAQEDGRVKLVLNPGLTFGTGSHATTRLCLQALEQHIHGCLARRTPLPAISTTSASASRMKTPHSTALARSITPSARETCSATKGSRRSSAATMT